MYKSWIIHENDKSSTSLFTSASVSEMNEVEWVSNGGSKELCFCSQFGLGIHKN